MFNLHLGNSLDHYHNWPAPAVIVSDGPYGISGYEGDPADAKHLPDLYEPHVVEWTKKSNHSTVLWFWCTELGWATVHPVLEKHGWKYQSCNIWNKGIKHIAGNCNGQTMRKFPVVTEVCVQYVRNPDFICINGLTVQKWIRSEWQRTGLKFSLANEACGVKNAATRKYLTLDKHFYFPPEPVFQKLAAYANLYGDPAGKPYFELPEDMSKKGGWSRLWYNWNFEYGVTNVWDIPALRNRERIKNGTKTLHLNQKPLTLMHRIIKAVCETGDVVWEPFGGLASASVAALQLKCIPYAAELNLDYYKLALARLEETKQSLTSNHHIL